MGWSVAAPNPGTLIYQKAVVKDDSRSWFGFSRERVYV